MNTKELIERQKMGKKKSKRTFYTWVRGHYRRLEDGRVVWIKGYWRKLKKKPKSPYPSHLFSSYTAPSGSFVIESWPPEFRFLKTPKRKKKRR